MNPTTQPPLTCEDCLFYAECGTIGGAWPTDEPCNEFEINPFIKFDNENNTNITRNSGNDVCKLRDSL